MLVCFRYQCGEVCMDEAAILAKRYYTRFTAWSRGNPGYHHCIDIATAIMGMNLDSGLSFFSLRKLMSFDPKDPSWWDQNLTGAVFAGVFHLCNKDRVKNPGRSDLRFDSHTYFISKTQFLKPEVRSGKLGWDAP